MQRRWTAGTASHRERLSLLPRTSRDRSLISCSVCYSASNWLKGSPGTVCSLSKGSKGRSSAVNIHVTAISDSLADPTWYFDLSFCCMDHISQQLFYLSPAWHSGQGDPSFASPPWISFSYHACLPNYSGLPDLVVSHSSDALVMLAAHP
jgi:hypothetical protein